MTTKNQKSAYKFALISVLFWSTVATALKVTLRYLDPIKILLYSSLSSLIILSLIVWYQNKMSVALAHIKRNFFLVLLLGAINPFLYYLLLFEAYDILPAQEAQAINYTWALTFAYLGVVFLKQKLSKWDVLAGLICYFGVLIIATKGNPMSLEFSNVHGVMLALASTVVWSLYWIFNTKTEVDAVVGLFANFLISVVLIVCYIMLTGGVAVPAWQGVLGSIHLGIFEMGVTFVLWLKAVKLTENISTISNLIFLSPFLSLIFIYLFVGEEIRVSTVVALFFIISGLLIQQKMK